MGVKVKVRVQCFLLLHPLQHSSSAYCLSCNKLIQPMHPEQGPRRPVACVMGTPFQAHQAREQTPNLGSPSSSQTP